MNLKMLRSLLTAESSAGVVVSRGGGGFIARPVAADTLSRRATGDRNSYRFSHGMPDLQYWDENARTIAAAVILQLHGGFDPDFSRSLADRVVFAIDRAGMRGHSDAAPTEDEVARAANALARRGHPVPPEDVRYALDAAFVRGWGE